MSRGEGSQISSNFRHIITHTYTIWTIYINQPEGGDKAVIHYVGCSKNTHSWDKVPANESELTTHTNW